LENTEVGVIFESPALGKHFVDTFIAKIDANAFRLTLEDGDIRWHGFENGEPVTYDKEPYTSWWQRFKVGVMGLFPIESQL